MVDPAGDEPGAAEVSPLRRGKRLKDAAAAGSAAAAAAASGGTAAVSTTASASDSKGKATDNKKAHEAKESKSKKARPPPAADKKAGKDPPESGGASSSSSSAPPPAAAAFVPPPPSTAVATTTSAAVAAAALPPQALYGYNPAAAAAADAPPAPSSSSGGGAGVVYNETNVFAPSEPEARPLTAAMRAARELERDSKDRVVFDATGNVNVTLKLPRRRSGDQPEGGGGDPAAASAAASLPLVGDESSLIVAAAAAAAAAQAAAAPVPPPRLSAPGDVAIKPNASMGSMQSTLNLVHSQNPSSMMSMMQRFGIGGFGMGGGVPGVLGADGDVFGAGGGGEDGPLRLRVLKRRVPREAELALRGQVVSEFAHVLQPDELLEENQQLGVSSQSAKFNRVFEDRFFELLVFSKAYGHMHVPKLYPDNPPLGRWVVKVRSWRKKNDPRLTPSRLGRLDQVGFIWEPKSHQDFWKVQGSNKKAEDLWENNFAELLEYRDEHGDCLIPKEFPPNQRLARWVTKQRKHYKAKQEGRYHSLDDDKERRLVEVGFVFNTKTKELMRDSVLRRYEDRWEEFCEKLQAFKREFGHAAVPRRWKRDPQLASWVMRQRFQWRKMKTGEHSYLNKARLERLEASGFIFGEIDRKLYPVGKMEDGEDDSVANEEVLDDAEMEDGEGGDGDKKPAALSWAVEKSAKAGATAAGAKRPPKRPMTKAKPTIKGKGTPERPAQSRKASAKRPRENDDDRTDSEASDGEDQGAKKPAAKKKPPPAAADQGAKAEGPGESEGEAASAGAAESSEVASAAVVEEKEDSGAKSKPAGGKKAAVKNSAKEPPAPAGGAAGAPAATGEPPAGPTPEEENAGTFVAAVYQEAVGKGMESLAISAAAEVE